MPLDTEPIWNNYTCGRDLFIVVGWHLGTREARRAAISEIVRQFSPASQGEIVERMKLAGFAVTQASVSRDAREMGLVKVAGRYRFATELSDDNAAIRADLSELVIDVQPVGANLIVLKTVTGAASRVGVAIDERRSVDVVGTIAGDDTVFIAARSRSGQGRVIASLRASTNAVASNGKEQGA